MTVLPLGRREKVENSRWQWQPGRQSSRSVVGGCSAGAFLGLLFGPGELAAGCEDCALAFGGVERRRVLVLAVDADGELFLTGGDGVVDVVDDFDVVALLDVLVGVLVDRQRDDPEVEEVRTVDASEALCEDALDTEVHRAHGSVLTRGALPVVLAG